MNQKEIRTHESLKLSNEKLSVKTVTFDFNAPPDDPIFVSNSLVTARHKYGLPAVAANQLGKDYRVIAVAGVESCLFNPAITYYSPEKRLMEEYSVSYDVPPIKRKRSEEIRIRYIDAFGKFNTATYKGLTARAVQIAIDQLDGKPFYEGLSKLQMDRLNRKKKKGIKSVYA